MQLYFEPKSPAYKNNRNVIVFSTLIETQVYSYMKVSIGCLRGRSL